MFERFTDRARRCVVKAQEFANKHNAEHIDTDHILYGLVSDKEGLAGMALADFGITSELVEEAIGELPSPESKPSRHPHTPFSPIAKKALESTLRIALQQNHNFIGPEHILRALINLPDADGVQILVGLGIDLDELRERITYLQNEATKVSTIPKFISVSLPTEQWRRFVEWRSSSERYAKLSSNHPLAVVAAEAEAHLSRIRSQ